MTYTITPDENDKEFLDRINWLPGHMIKSIRDIKKNISSVDIILEVRDARVPLVSGNSEIYDLCTDRPSLIVFNKANLADPEVIKLWKSWLVEKKESFIFVNALDKSSINQIVKRSKEIAKAYQEKSNKSQTAKKDLSMLIFGLPNTGKSTIINKLSNRNATKAAATPGQTKIKLWVKTDKGVQILDTPGVMPPVITHLEHAMWLSAIHAIPDHIITPEYSACFLVEHLLKIKSSVFKDFYDFVDDQELGLVEALDHIGKKRGCVQSGGSCDYDRVYTIVLNDFRKGSLGLISFELPPTGSD